MECVMKANICIKKFTAKNFLLASLLMCYQTILSFRNIKKSDFWKDAEKAENADALVTNIFSSFQNIL